MCGLVGLYLPDGATVVEPDLDRMLRVMTHRGPDDRGVWENAARTYRAGFNRLSILDLKGSHQPIVAPDRVLTGNGEIYNYKDLRRAPEVTGHAFQTDGDMEPALALHRAMGADFVDRLNGMFALALYERDAHRLTLVRDRLGIKPLYWVALPGGGILYASEIKPLLLSGLINAAVDETAVSAYLSHGYVPAPLTLFQGIRKLPPGHRLIAARDGTVTVERYWAPQMAERTYADAEEAEQVMLDLLRDSVKLQLQSDVPVGALLSGGLDSGLVTAMAAQESAHAIKTFTVRFQGGKVDETPLAQMVADRYGTDHNVLDVDASGIGAHLPRLSWFMEEPLNDAAVLPNFLIEEALGREVTVVLNGSGGDELFAGYGRYFRLPVEAKYLRVPDKIRCCLAEPILALADPMTTWKLKRAEKFDTDRGGYLHDHSTHFPAPMRALIGNGMVLPDPAQRAAFQAFVGPAQSGALAADLATYLPDDLLLLLDRSSMASSVEGRVPFLDHRLVEAALAVPEAIRTPGGRQKALERAMAKTLLPEPLLSAPKHGFVSPVPAWMRAGLDKTVRRLLTAKTTLERGWWSTAGIDRLLADPDKHGYRVYTLLMLELAVRQFVESSAGETAPSASLEDMADAA